MAEALGSLGNSAVEAYGQVRSVLVGLIQEWEPRGRVMHDTFS